MMFEKKHGLNNLTDRSLCRVRQIVERSSLVSRKVVRVVFLWSWPPSIAAAGHAPAPVSLLVERVEQTERTAPGISRGRRLA